MVKAILFLRSLSGTSHSYAQTHNNCPICNCKEYFILVRLHKEEEVGCPVGFPWGREEVDANDRRCLHLLTPKSSVCTMGSAWHTEINSLSLQGSGQTLVEPACPWVICAQYMPAHSTMNSQGRGMTVWHTTTE